MSYVILPNDYWDFPKSEDGQAKELAHKSMTGTFRVDEVPVKIGLLNQHGEPIYRMPEPKVFGFDTSGKK